MGESEAEFQAAIMVVARLRGWRVYHTRDSRGSEAGFPDLAMVHDRLGWVYFVEVKTQTGVLTPDQQEWVHAIEVVSALPGSRVAVFVWRPSDWDDLQRYLVEGRRA